MSSHKVDDTKLCFQASTEHASKARETRPVNRIAETELTSRKASPYLAVQRERENACMQAGRQAGVLLTTATCASNYRSVFGTSREMQGELHTERVPLSKYKETVRSVRRARACRASEKRKKIRRKVARAARDKERRLVYPSLSLSFSLSLVESARVYIRGESKGEQTVERERDRYTESAISKKGRRKKKREDSKKAHSPSCVSISSTSLT